MDLQLILEDVEDFLIFNTRDQCVEMRNLPFGHPLERFLEGNNLDVNKYFKKVENLMFYVNLSSQSLSIVPDCRARDLPGDGDQVAGRAGGGAAAALHRLLQPVPRLHEGGVEPAPARPLPLQQGGAGGGHLLYFSFPDLQ